MGRTLITPNWPRIAHSHPRETTCGMKVAANLLFRDKKKERSAGAQFPFDRIHLRVNMGT